MKGFIKLNRSDEAMNLQHNMCANPLLYIIALRAARKENKVLGLKPGDALLGDWQNYGMSRQQYRTALKNLTDWSYIKVRVTNKGTIATICNTDVYDLNSNEANHQTTIKQPSSNHQTTIHQPSDNHQVTTNKNNKNIKNERNKEIYPSIPNSEKLTLDEQEKAAAQIVVDHFTSKGFKATDICIFTNQHIKRQDRFDSEVAMTMPKVNRAFYSWVYANNITNIQVLQHHIKMVQNQKINLSYAVIKQAIELIRTAVVNNWKNLYFDKIKK
jgi:hypothetical protein